MFHFIENSITEITDSTVSLSCYAVFANLHYTKFKFQPSNAKTFYLPPSNCLNLLLCLYYLQYKRFSCLYFPWNGFCPLSFFLGSCRTYRTSIGQFEGTGWARIFHSLLPDTFGPEDLRGPFRDALRTASSQSILSRDPF